MDIIGKVVYHQKLKKPCHKGIITGVVADGKYIDVSFEDDDKESRRFLFPQSFEQTSSQPPILSTSDDELKKVIESAQKRSLCSVCHLKCAKLKSYGEINVCAACEKEIIYCHNCGKAMLKSQAEEDPFYDRYYCKHCYCVLFKTCSVCGRPHYVEEIVDSPYLAPNQVVCDSCIDTVLAICDECGELHPFDRTKEIDGFVLCDTCFSEKAGICDICKEQSISLKNGLCHTCFARNEYWSKISDPIFLNQKTHRIAGGKRDIRNLNTVRLMSRLNKSFGEDPFDILILEDFIHYNGRCLDLVVVSEIPWRGDNTVHQSCTMTEMKADKGFRIRRAIESILDDEKSRTMKVDETHNFIAMYKAYILRAKTYADMNYGDRWYGKDYCEEGNKYGDTSEFYIVGAIENLDPIKRMGGFVLVKE